MIRVILDFVRDLGVFCIIMIAMYIMEEGSSDERTS